MQTAENPFTCILVVEDDPDVLKMVCYALDLRGYKVLSAVSGEDAVEIAVRQNSPISLLLTDIEMPGMDGLELSHRLRQSLNLPVLLMSGWTDSEWLDGTPLLRKPFTLEQLAEAVDKVLKEDTLPSRRTPGRINAAEARAMPARRERSQAGRQ